MITKLKIWLYGFYRIIQYARGKAKIYRTGNTKSGVAIFNDLMGWMFREHYFNDMYYVLGLNIKGTKTGDYIGKNEFIAYRDKAERHLRSQAGCENLQYSVITKDKFYANSLFKATHIGSVENAALISNDMVIFNNGDIKGMEALLDFKRDYFIKNIVLEAGDGVLHCEPKDRLFVVNGQSLSLEELKAKLGKEKWIIQFAHKSHPEIRKINSSALNITRIVTILDGNDPVYLTGFQSFATGGQPTDSWTKGSIYVGIDPKHNQLMKDGYYHPAVGKEGIVGKHPDSGITFEGYKINGLQPAVNLCLKAHKLLYFNFLVGWDVAITEKGPLILEANENPGMQVVQCFNGGLREQIRNYYQKCISTA
jgi:hypothetical protein